MALQGGIQLILQSKRADGRFDCLGFAGIAIVNPVFMALDGADTPQAQSDLDDLRRELILELNSLARTVQQVPVPCGGNIGDLAACHAHREPDCQKLLVLVGDDTQAVVLKPGHQAWTAGSPNYHVLPVYRNTARGSVSALLPTQFRHLNAEFWVHSVAEVLPAIFGLSGLTTQNPRIFISYRQKDSSTLAVQLFDALSRAGFDAFLDHFRIAPGVNFQARLTQELGDKSMVLLIESENILESEWTTYEINVAKTCSLGVLTLHVPGGPQVPGIDSSVRMDLDLADFDSGTFSTTARLKDAALETVVARVKLEHDRAFVRRRQILRSSLEGALLEQGVSPLPLSSTGIVRVRSRAGGEYLVWLTPRPPELPDFHRVHGQAIPPVKGVVIGLSRLMEPMRLAETGWLAGLSQIKMIDEGHLKLAASEMAQGVL
jgi:hypothetical protein